ncbi:hypothetical protein J6590_081611 [Homalodisca vitripennis]|nr:hypothetical protein J6590_081611 [Homalodisca vitripennis]
MPQDTFVVRYSFDFTVIINETTLGEVLVLIYREDIKNKTAVKSLSVKLYSKFTFWYHICDTAGKGQLHQSSMKLSSQEILPSSAFPEPNDVSE